MKNSGIIAFFAGAVVGAGIALLLAPESGEETRRKVRDFIDKEVYDIEDNIDYLAELAEEKADKVSKAVAGTKRKVQRKVETKINGK